MKGNELFASSCGLCVIEAVVQAWFWLYMERVRTNCRHALYVHMNVSMRAMPEARDGSLESGVLLESPEIDRQYVIMTCVGDVREGRGSEQRGNDSEGDNRPLPINTTFSLHSNSLIYLLHASKTRTPKYTMSPPSSVPEQYRPGFLPPSIAKQMQENLPGSQQPLEPAPLDTLLADGTEYKAAGKLQGKKAVVTGGDSGIGRAVAIL